MWVIIESRQHRVAVPADRMEASAPLFGDGELETRIMWHTGNEIARATVPYALGVVLLAASEAIKSREPVVLTDPSLPPARRGCTPSATGES